MARVERCSLCGSTREEHGNRVHQFTTSGNLEVQSSPPPRKVGVDVALRLVLIDMGLITADDMARKEAELVDKLRRAAVDTPDRQDFE